MFNVSTTLPLPKDLSLLLILKIIDVICLHIVFTCRYFMISNILKARPGETFSISSEGLEAMLKRPRDPQYPDRHISWTDDFSVELPIRKSAEGVASLEPTTLIDEFRRANEIFRDRAALSVKRKGKWHTLTFG